MSRHRQYYKNSIEEQTFRYDLHLLRNSSNYYKIHFQFENFNTDPQEKK